MSRRKSRECESRPAAAPTLSRSLLLSSPTGACIPATACSPANRCFDTSCFSGEYVTPGIDEAYLKTLHDARNDSTMAIKNRDHLRPVGVPVPAMARSTSGQCEGIYNSDEPRPPSPGASSNMPI